MPQPIRKTIQEAHPEAMLHPFYTLLVDGNSLLFRAFKDGKINTRGEHIGGIYMFLQMLRGLMEKQTYDYIYVFFDSEDSGIERYKFYHSYKANRDKHYAEHYGVSEYWKQYTEAVRNMQNYIFEKQHKAKAKKRASEESNPDTFEEKKSNEYKEFIDENFDRERDILCKYFNELFIRWEIDEETEGDDLISYYVHNKKPEELIVIASGDQDLTQLISDKVCIYDLNTKKYLSKKNFKAIKGFPSENVVLKKIFLGDTSDNIGNINGLSEARLLELMPEINERTVTVEEVKNRAKLMCEARVKDKKKPLKWQENIINGVSNKEYDGDFYDINDRLINLDKYLITEGAKKDMDEMMYMPQDPTDRTMENLYKYIEEDDITDLRDSRRFANFLEPFQSYANREKMRYKKWFENNNKK